MGDSKGRDDLMLYVWHGAPKCQKGGGKGQNLIKITPIDSSASKRVPYHEFLGLTHGRMANMLDLHS